MGIFRSSYGLSPILCPAKLLFDHFRIFFRFSYGCKTIYEILQAFVRFSGLDQKCTSLRALKFLTLLDKGGELKRT